jgi:hypothetical protein
MDEQAMMKWVDEVWGPYTKDNRRDGRDIYLLQHEFSLHLMGSVNNQINKLGTEVDIITGGYTGSIQVFDKGINKPFKGYLRDHFEEWMCTNGSRRQPSRAEVAQWVANAWEQVTTATIVNTWKIIGHKVADDDDDDEENSVANQPGTGQESTGSSFYIIKKSKVKNYNKLNNIPSPGYHPRGDTKSRQQGGDSSLSL